MTDGYACPACGHVDPAIDDVGVTMNAALDHMNAASADMAREAARLHRRSLFSTLAATLCLCLALANLATLLGGVIRYWP